MHQKYNAEKHSTRKKPRPGSQLTLLYSLNGKVICSADYRLSADARFLEIPLPITRRLAET